jgi:predicted GNAT superfamily acetyltransferase
MIVADRQGPEGGVYVKRILVADKERGTGKAALRAFIAEALGRPGRRFVWLNLREPNACARAVYRALGFERFEPSLEEGAGGEMPHQGVFSMRIPAAS